MSDHTKINLQDVEDSVGGRVPGIEGRFARSSIDSQHLGVSLFRYAPGFRSNKGHHHLEQEEVYVVLDGSGDMLVGEEVHPLRKHDVVRVAPTTVRAFSAGDDGLEILAVGSDRPEGGDGKMVDIAWPD